MPEMSLPLDITEKPAERGVFSIPVSKKKTLGQFMTPAAVADFMVSFFDNDSQKLCRLLDAGAGRGMLSCAFLNRWLSGELNFSEVEMKAYEIDRELFFHLSDNLSAYYQVKRDIICGDYIFEACHELMPPGNYTHIILNPPYKKIAGRSAHKKLLQEAGVSAVNLYSSFVALAIRQAAFKGQIVAIIPRSFCNGSYYRCFRDFILENTAIRRIHLFESRKDVFLNDNILQENIIIHLEKGGKQGDIKISTSTDAGLSDFLIKDYPFEEIIDYSNFQHFIHIPAGNNKNGQSAIPAAVCALSEIGVEVSTGPVVDFRLREYLHDMPIADSVPLIYPAHFGHGTIKWPILKCKKPNAISRNDKTEKWLYPSGYYCVVRRFSSKEEKRRVVANVVSPEQMGNPPMLGFENHLNVFHEKKAPLEKALAYGLAAFLNSSAADKYFRRFSGHTQVNATDLRMIKYPCRNKVILLGEWAMRQSHLKPEEIDSKLKSLVL